MRSSRIRHPERLQIRRQIDLPVRDLQLPADVFTMPADRRRGDTPQAGDLFRAQPVPNQVADIDLRRGQGMEVIHEPADERSCDLFEAGLQ